MHTARAQLYRYSSYRYIFIYVVGPECMVHLLFEAIAGATRTAVVSINPTVLHLRGCKFQSVPGCAHDWNLLKQSIVKVDTFEWRCESTNLSKPGYCDHIIKQIKWGSISRCLQFMCLLEGFVTYVLKPHHSICCSFPDEVIEKVIMGW